MGVHFYGKVTKMLQALKMDAPHLNDNILSLIVYYGLPPLTMDAVLATIVAGGGAQIQLNIEVGQIIFLYKSI